jgi:hypothetical protein
MGEGGVLTLRLNRPEKKNALSREMYGALSDGLLRRRPTTRRARCCWPGATTSPRATTSPTSPPTARRADGPARRTSVALDFLEV